MSMVCRTSMVVLKTPQSHKLALRHILQQCSRLVASSAPLQAEGTYRGLELEIRNKKMGRPLSPFLSSYKMHFPMATSLMHRVTGTGYSSLYYLSVIGVVGLAPSFPALIESIQSLHLDPNLILATKFVLTWPVMYHMFNGLRHLAWDAGAGFDLPMVYKSGFFVLGLTTIVTLFLLSL
ncbi:unnamed protein product [Notodromas monacha]|uniref:Succinate dehydrogenase cytochrome b560 subunit, mitochondrial n=1 Tax=Notodromas monacha TaxID=399045 RepID=A0A7R9BPV6_9CRUS|nr:unnamed protein product [Notodromas monacha]CAG0918601.1 unnamed protein product [Notodromas monacha]